VWTRVETPAGVIVELQSPGTGPLGEAGVGGWVDTRFWERFGAAILLSVIEGGANAATARAAGPSRGTTVSIAGTTNAGTDVIAKSMEPTVNIPTVLYKNQGERVAIFVARDLDFRSVYGLERAARDERSPAGP
jgi:type IV secretion system protein VirB10